MSSRSTLRPRGGLLLAAVSALVTAVVCFAPLHQQAMIQALAAHELDRLGPLEAGLRLDVSSTTVDAIGLRVTVPVDHEKVLAELPRQVREHMDGPIVSVRTAVTTATPDGRFATGPLLSRDDACRHLAWVEGRCPDEPREVAISRSDAEAFGWAPGDRLRILEALSGGVVAVEQGYIGIRVVGVYEQVDLPWWEGEALSGTSARLAVPGGQQVLHDAFLVSDSGVLGPRRIRWADAIHRFDLRLDREGVDSAVVDDLGALTGSLMQEDDFPYETLARSALPDVAAELDRARSQAGIVVPLLVAQVALVGLVMLAVALQAAATQRRPRVAVARLRGNGVGPSRRMLAAELLPTTLAGVLLGMALALPLGTASRRWVLPPGAPFEVPVGYWLAAATAALTVLATVAVVSHATARIPLADLLQRSPTRRPARRLGAGTVAVAAGAAVLAAAVVTGGVTGPVALLVPAAMALASGLVLARLVTLLAVPAGRRLLARRRPHAAVGLLQLARRPATVQVASLLTVGVALLVFAADAHATAERNRQLAARQELGAPVRLTLAQRDVAAVRDALADIDPRGELATPLVEIPTPAAGTTVGVVPEQLLRVGFAGDHADVRAALTQLRTDVPPVVLTGTHIRARAQWQTASRTARRTPPRLSLVLVPTGGSPVDVPLGTAPAGRSGRLGAEIPCEQGCVLTGIRVQWDVSIATISKVELRGIRLDGVPATLGSPGSWQQDTGAPMGHATVSASGRGRATLSVTNYGATGLLVRNVVDPAVIPAVLSQRAGNLVLNAYPLEGDAWPVEELTTVRRVPGIGNDTAIVDLTTLTRRGERARGSAQVHVLVGDPARVSEVREALAAQGQHVASARTLPRAADDLAASVPGWSLQLALLVGGTGLVLSGLALVLVGATTRRSRARDLASLRLTGTPPAHLGRVARWEVVPMVVAATLAGAACGVAGAASALGSVPLFAHPPEVSTLDLSTPWPAVLLTTAVALVGLLVLALAAARAAVRQARLDLVRSTL